MGSGSPAPRSCRVGNVSASTPRRWPRRCVRRHAHPARPAPPRRGTARPARPRAARGQSLDHVGVDRRRAPGHRRLAVDTAVAPRHVGGQDQRGHLRRRPHRRGDRGRRVATEIDRRRRAVHPTGRHVARHGLDVAGERGVVLQVRQRVVADDHHHRHPRLARRCAGWPARCPDPGRGATTRPRACRACARSRRRRRWRPPRTARARRACRARRRARRRSASPTYRGS